MNFKESTKIVGFAADGEILIGTVLDLAEHFGITEYRLREHSLRGDLTMTDRWGKTFVLKRVKTSEFRKLYKPRKAIKYIPKEEKTETELEETVRLLKQYGNTNLSHHPGDLISQLENLGLNVSYRKMKTDKSHYILELEGYYY